MAGAIHNVGSIKVQWVFENKYLMHYPDGRQVWTTTFETVREESKRKVQFLLFD